MKSHCDIWTSVKTIHVGPFPISRDEDGLANHVDLAVTRVQWFCPVPVSVLLQPFVSDGDMHGRICRSRWDWVVVPLMFAEGL